MCLMQRRAHNNQMQFETTVCEMGEIMTLKAGEIAIDSWGERDHHVAKRARSLKRNVILRMQFYKIMPKAPKVKRADLRRQYATLFAETFNSGDLNKIWGFCKSCCTDDIQWIQRWHGKESYYNFPSYLQVDGMDQVAEYWYFRLLLAPDLVLLVNDAQLHVRSDGVAYIELTVGFRSTRLYDCPTSDELVLSYDHSHHRNNYQQVQILKEEDEEESEEEHVKKINDRAVEKAEYAITHLDPVVERDYHSEGGYVKSALSCMESHEMSDRHAMKVVGHIVLSLNEEHRISCIHYDLALV